MSGEALAGPVRVPRNLAAGVVGGTNDDGPARERGFRGGAVAGSVQADQLPPLVRRAFANGVFENDSQALYFRDATTDGELAGSLLAIESAPGPELGYLGRAIGREVVRPDHNCPHGLGGMAGTFTGRR